MAWGQPCVEVELVPMKFNGRGTSQSFKVAPKIVENSSVASYIICSKMPRVSGPELLDAKPAAHQHDHYANYRHDLDHNHRDNERVNEGYEPSYHADHFEEHVHPEA